VDSPTLLAEALERDRVLALEHAVEFSVVSRAAGSGPRAGPLRQHGTFDSPVDAVALGRSLGDQDVTVVADGHGAYWHSAAPNKVNCELLELVCRHKVLGPEESEREYQREERRHIIERLRSEQHFAEAAELVRGCEDVNEAELRLQEVPLSLSRPQARHLLINRNLRLLTRQGQRDVQADLNDAVETLQNYDSE